jgi:hypothetical protein
MMSTLCTRKKKKKKKKKKKNVFSLKSYLSRRKQCNIKYWGIKGWCAPRVGLGFIAFSKFFK